MSWYLIPEDWLPIITLLAVVVALVTPWIIEYLNNKPKKSNLQAVGISIVDQAGETHGDWKEEHCVGRLVLTNTGKFVAKSVTANLEKIFYDEEERENFFPAPLKWTHGQLNKDGETVRDIYPNQTVYLDVYNYFSDERYEDVPVNFAVGGGVEIHNLSVMNYGKSVIYIKLYQESGQVEEIRLEANWDKGTPSIKIV